MGRTVNPLPGEDGIRRFESWCGDELGGREVARYGYATISAAIASAGEIAKREKIAVRVTEKRRRSGDDLSVVALPDGTVHVAERHGGDGIPSA